VTQSLLSAHSKVGRMEMRDAELLRRARRDPDAFCVFYDRHAARLQSWLTRETGDSQVAVDLTAEAFAQALRSLGRFRGDGADSGAAWLYAIARHLLYRFRQHARVETRSRRRLGMATSYQLEEGFADVDEHLSEAHLRQAALTLLGELPIDQQRAVQLRVIDGLSYKAVARELGCTEQAARLRVSRALRRMKTQLEGGVT
jgi:RNA polymerase sigma factor (sigma-70 family)